MITPRSITEDKNREMLYSELSYDLEVFLQDNFPNEYKVQDSVRTLLRDYYPDDGVSILESYQKSEAERFDDFVRHLNFNDFLFHVIHGDQRRGKDVDAVVYCEAVIELRKFYNMKPARFVTLMMTQFPPFVDEKDVYFSLLDLPRGTKEQPVFVLCPELELIFPARATQSGKENDYLDKLSKTFAQCHQNFIGAVKYEYGADIVIFRICNSKSYKFVDPFRDGMDLEREGAMSSVDMWLRPQDINDKTETLIAYGNNHFKVHIKKPNWYNDDYSEQFRDVPDKFVEAYVKNYFTFFPDDKLNRSDVIKIQNETSLRFRKKISAEKISEIFNSVVYTSLKKY